MAKKADKSKPIKERKARALVTDEDGWVEPGVAVRFTWEEYTALGIGEQRDAPEGSKWSIVRNAIRQVVKRNEAKGLRLLIRRVENASGEPTGRIIIKRVA